MAIKAYKYRLYPTRRQITILERTLESCRWVYNETLAMRKNAWEQARDPYRTWKPNANSPSGNRRDQN